MRLLLAWLIAMIRRPSEGNAAEVQADGWSTAVLWNSDVVSAGLLFKPSASLADKDWLALELENHTLKPLEFGQTWMNLGMTLKEIPSGKVLTTSGLSGIFRSIKTLPPGRHRFYGDTFESPLPTWDCHLAPGCASRFRRKSIPRSREKSVIRPQRIGHR